MHLPGYIMMYVCKDLRTYGLCVVISSGVQPVGRLFTFSVSLRSVSYIFTASPTSGAGYEVTFIPQRSGIPQPQTERLGRAGFRNKAGLIPDVTYRLQVVAVLGGVKSTPVSKDFTTRPDGKTAIYDGCVNSPLQIKLCCM